MVWTAPAPDPVEGPTVGADRPMLEGYLGYHRATLLNICAGLNAMQHNGHADLLREALDGVTGR